MPDLSAMGDRGGGSFERSRTVDQAATPSSAWGLSALEQMLVDRQHDTASDPSWRNIASGSGGVAPGPPRIEVNRAMAAAHGPGGVAPFAGTVHVARGTMSTDGAAISQPLGAPSGGPGGDSIDDIVDQVYRKVKRELRIDLHRDLERKGTIVHGF